MNHKQSKFLDVNSRRKYQYEAKFCRFWDRKNWIILPNFSREVHMCPSMPKIFGTFFEMSIPVMDVFLYIRNMFFLFDSLLTNKGA